MKKLTIVCLLLLIGVWVKAEMPALAGDIKFDNQAFRDNVYDYAVSKASNCIGLGLLEIYEVGSGTGTVYGIRFFMKFPLIKAAVRNNVFDKIKTFKDDVRIIWARFWYHKCYHDEIQMRPCAVWGKEIK